MSDLLWLSAVVIVLITVCPIGCLGVHRRPISTHIVHIQWLFWVYCTFLWTLSFISGGANTGPYVEWVGGGGEEAKIKCNLDHPDPFYLAPQLSHHSSRYSRVYLLLVGVSCVVRPTGAILWPPLVLAHWVFSRRHLCTLLRETIFIGWGLAIYAVFKPYQVFSVGGVSTFYQSSGAVKHECNTWPS